jgi:hypothetical protein
MSLLLLKARPISEQLADRLQDPGPDGLELYLDRADLADEAAMNAAATNVEALEVPPDFALLIEGPVVSLDGEFFDLARDSDADREVVRRLGRLARRLRARAVNVHVIAPTDNQNSLNQHLRRSQLERGLDLTRFFVEEIAGAGSTPTVENMPPILRMRQSAYYFSAIGMAAEDLVWLAEQVSGLRLTLDLSHTGLYVTAQRLAREHRNWPEQYRGLLAFIETLPPVESVEGYAATFGDLLETCHVSNSSGLLGEGEPYDRGDLDLDQLVALLAPQTAFFVTETLERDHGRAIEMRRALQAMRSALQAVA